ncbi:MAG: matrixin family metalloprotease, partial [Pseudomonadota bacterium]|nr:matrixin family metalloprotease [Pseudomonadota bacterium]
MSEYALEGPSWPSKAVTWSFAAYEYPADASDPFSGPIAVPAEQALVMQAFAAWQAVSGLTFVEEPDSANPPGAADIRVGFGALSAASEDTIGLTDWSYNTQTNAFEPDTVVRLRDPSLDPVTADASGTLVYQGAGASFYQVILHEVGHALGLDHSTDPTAVMYPFATAENRQLGNADVSGIQALYGPPAGANSVAPGMAAAVSTAPLVAVQDLTTGGAAAEQAMSPVSVPGSQLQDVFTDITSDSLLIAAATPNVFLQSGAGNDVLEATSGQNVLDGGMGSNLLVGGTGTDTFYLDGRGAAPTWSTVADFKPGDALILWGWQGDVGKLGWSEGQGMPGWQGATLHPALSGT